MYNLIEYSDNYQDSSAPLYQYKRDEPPEGDPIPNLAVDNSNSFKYKVELLGDPVVANNIARRNVKVVVPLKLFQILRNAFNQLQNNDDGDAIFIINDTKLYVPVVTLSKEDNKDFIEQQNKGFQRSIYWNEYKTKEQTEDANATKYINLDLLFKVLIDCLLWHIID